MIHSVSPVARWRSRYRRHVLGGLATLLTLLATSVGWSMYSSRRDDPRQATQPFRMGFTVSPPYFIGPTDGSPHGPVYEIFREAARRRATGG